MKRAEKAGEKLKHLLSLLPVIAANPGITLAELLRLSNFHSREELMSNLNRLIMFGAPPFSPADYIDIRIEGEEDNVYLESALGLDRPEELTPMEWALVGQTLIDTIRYHKSGDKNLSLLRDLLFKITKIPIDVTKADPFERNHNLIQEAIDDGLAVRFHYYSLSGSGDMIERSVDPYLLFYRYGVAYLCGYCHLRKALRFFHLERIDQLEIENCPIRKDAPAELLTMIQTQSLFQSSTKGDDVQIAFDATLHPSMKTYFHVEDVKPYKSSKEDVKGWLKASCRVSDPVWFKHIVRSFGDRIVILSPDELKSAYVKELDDFKLPKLLT